MWVYPLFEGEIIRLFFYDDISPGSVPAYQDYPVTANTWSRIQVTGAFGTKAKLRRLSATSLYGHSFYLDGAQLEIGRIATPYCDGSQPGCFWSGNPDNSSSSRIESITYLHRCSH
jgi:hypothetical protein